MPAPDVDALAAAVDLAFAGKALPGTVAARAIAERHIAALDGDLACDRLAAEMLELDAPRLPLPGSPWRAVRAAVTTAPGRARRGFERLRSPGAAAAPTATGTKFPGASSAEIEAMVAGLREVSGRFRDVVWAERAADVFAFVAPSVPPA
jgi:hypothetical protein